MMTTFRYIVIALFFVAIPVSFLSGDETLEGVKANEERWEAMDARRKKAIVDTYRKWKSLSRPEREAIRSKYDRFRALEPEQRDAVAINTPRWVKLDDERRKKIRKYFRPNLPSHMRHNCHRRPPRGFLRVVGTLLEEGREVSMPAIMRRFVEQLVAENRLTPEDVKQISAAKAAKKFEILGMWLIAQGLQKYPDALEGLEKGSKEYKFACKHLGMRMFTEMVGEIFEPTQLEMAMFIRYRARRHLTYEKQRKIASYSAEELDRFAKQVYDKNGIDVIVSKMPERMRNRFNSFDEAKKIATIRMVFEPIRRRAGTPRSK